MYRGIVEIALSSLRLSAGHSLKGFTSPVTISTTCAHRQHQFVTKNTGLETRLRLHYSDGMNTSSNCATIAEAVPSSDEQLTWKKVLGVEREKPYFKSVMAHVEEARRSGKTVYPSNSEVFAALTHTPFNDVKVVILGQDPYHGPGQAHGLCFSVQEGIQNPPSLVNIFKEIESDLGIPRPQSGSLIRWATQGVLLLNAVLTVEARKAGSHANLGWEQFTDSVIQQLNDRREGIVFLLWGSYAQKKGSFIDQKKHLVLKSPHPSPLSAHRGFMGCKHFSKTNVYLAQSGKSPIDWS
jgi:uracil-DNA glycosylase